MAYRRVAISRRKLVEAYYVNGVKQTLRSVGKTLNIAPNTARAWLIRFDLYDSQRSKKSSDNT